MLNFLIFIFTSCIVGILIICYFFLNADLDKEQQNTETSKRTAGDRVETCDKNTSDSNVSSSGVVAHSKVEDITEETIKSTENERCLREKIVQLEKELNTENIKVKELELELKEERLKSQEQIKQKIDDVISNFEPKILELIARSGEKVDRLLAINKELFENNKRQAKQENEMSCFETEMMSKMDEVIKTLERKLPKSICLAEENDDIASNSISSSHS